MCLESRKKGTPKKQKVENKTQSKIIEKNNQMKTSFANYQKQFTQTRQQPNIQAQGQTRFQMQQSKQNLNFRIAPAKRTGQKPIEVEQEVELRSFTKVGGSQQRQEQKQEYAKGESKPQKLEFKQQIPKTGDQAICCKYKEEVLCKFQNFARFCITSEKHTCECNSKIIQISNQSKYHVAIINEDQILYLKDNQKGKLYSVKYDEAFNPQYSIKEGSFINQQQIKIENPEKEYIGKSNDEKKKKEEFQVQIFKQELGVKKRIKIMDTNGNILNNGPLKNIQITETWIKFNQQISKKDVMILQPSSQQWVTSSIIDSYALHLNITNSKYYFSLSPEDRNIKKRIYFVISSVFTSFFSAQTYYKVEAQHLEQFRKEFLEFQEIEYQVWQVYEQLAFVINQNNFHWFLILIDFKSKKIRIYDSMGFKQGYAQSPYFSYFNIFFQNFGFQEKLLPKWSKKNGQQRDGYTCGYHTCSFMKYISEKHNYKYKKKYQFNEKEIKKELLALISKRS